MKDKIKELIKSGEHEDLIVDAVEWYVGPDSWTKAGAAFDIKERLKQALTPKKKPVDMSIFVDSPIDCEFEGFETNDIITGFHQLTDIYESSCETSYESEGVFQARKCKPRTNYWFSIDLFANGSSCGLFIEKLENAGFELDCNYFDGCLRSFKITGLQDDYCWPWERE